MEESKKMTWFGTCSQLLRLRLWYTDAESLQSCSRLMILDRLGWGRKKVER